MKRVVLTFDDGPNPPYTSKILDVLKKYKIKAVFFLLGRNVKLHPKTAKRIKSEGHVIGNHSFSHKDLRKISPNKVKEEIAAAEKIFRKTLGVRPRFFRPPYGLYNNKVKGIIEDMGYKMVNWNICPEDWKSPKAKIIAARVLKQAGIKQKGIILLHDGSNIRQGRSRKQTVLALDLIIKKLSAKGGSLPGRQAGASGGKNKKFVFDTDI
ncbi:MAG: polysaccharide deacetylase family protein [Candidatus Omnitrophica bacterium]|nr:polysaccharide deacetylase family protein [Candidatus Omnitrophota bacterium]